MPTARKRKAESPDFVDSQTKSQTKGEEINHDIQLRNPSNVTKKRGCLRKESQPPQVIISNETQFPAINRSPMVYIKTQKDIKNQEIIHKKIFNRIILTERARVIPINFRSNPKSFTVFPELLKLLARSFETYDFNSSISTPKSNTAPTATSNLIVHKSYDFSSIDNITYSLPQNLKEISEDKRRQNLIATSNTRQEVAPFISTGRESGNILALSGSSSNPIELKQHTHPIHTIRVAEFGCFLAWAYSGTFSEEMIIETAKNLELPANCTPSLVQLWFVGAKLRSPGFQNRVIQCILSSERLRDEEWPSVVEVKEIESRSNLAIKNPLYELAATCIAEQEPLKKFDRNSHDFKGWEKLWDQNSPLFKHSMTVDTTTSVIGKTGKVESISTWLVEEQKLENI